MPYALNGDFVECCDCFTVCPCWVNDVPDEDHCSGLYLWKFGKGSEIGTTDVAGMHVAVAAFHAVGSRGQAILFIDANDDPIAYAELKRVFSGQLGGSGIGALRKLLGDILDCRPAQITSTFTAGKFNVELEVNGQSIARAAGGSKSLDGQKPMTLRNTALNDELGIGPDAVVVQAMDDLTVDVAALPGGPLYLRGRSGMRGKFRYVDTGPLPHDGPPGNDPPAGRQGAKTEG